MTAKSHPAGSRDLRAYKVAPTGGGFRILGQHLDQPWSWVDLDWPLDVVYPTRGDAFEQIGRWQAAQLAVDTSTSRRPAPTRSAR